MSTPSKDGEESINRIIRRVAGLKDRNVKVGVPRAKRSLPVSCIYSELSMHNVPGKKLHHINLPGHAHELTFSCYRRLPLEKLTVPGEDKFRFWQAGGGYDRNIEKHATLIQMIEYIHLNPVRRGLVKAASDWLWSSASWYEGKESVIPVDSIR